VAVQLESADTAVVTSYFQYYTDTLTSPTLQVIGWYRHFVRRTADGWKVARRELHYG
jgi:hypothetical protein